MDIKIKKTDHLEGKVTVPGSKSYTHRVIAAASLYGSDTLVINPSNSRANGAMIDACSKLGADIKWTDDKTNLRIRGVQGSPAAPDLIHVGNSGTALRIMIALASLGHGRTVIDGDDSLRNRPAKLLIDALNTLGSHIRGTRRPDDASAEEFAPVTIDSDGLEGGTVDISGAKSSQYITGLLLAANYAKNDVKINVQGTIVSESYIRMTLEVLRRFGVTVDHSADLRSLCIKSQQSIDAPKTYSIPGDYSQAAFFFAAACLIDSDITVWGLDSDDEQGDKAIVGILEKMGAKIEQNSDHYRIRGPFDLKGIEVDLLDSPDLFPVLAVLGVYARGRTQLYNMPQIRSKETDRIAVIERELQKHGIKTESGPDEMTVYQSDLLPECDFSAKGEQGVSDHRIAMALSLIGMQNGSCTLREADSVNISYPDYFAHMGRIGAKTEISN